MVQPKRTDSQPPIPTSVSFIKAGYDQILDEQINNILDLRFNLIQSVKALSVNDLPAKENIKFLEVLRKSLGSDWEDLEKFKNTFVQSGVCSTLEEAQKTKRPLPIDRPAYIAILRNFFKQHKVPTCEDFILFRREAQLLTEAFPVLNNIDLKKILSMKSKIDSGEALNLVLQELANNIENVKDEELYKYLEFYNKIHRLQVRREDKEIDDPLKVFGDYYFANRFSPIFVYSQEDANRAAKKSFEAEQKSYYDYATNFRMPPLNLSRLKKLSVFNQQDLSKFDADLRKCVNLMVESLNLQKLINSIQSSYSGNIRLTYGQLYEALLSASDRIAFHGEGDVLKFLNSWLKSQANEEQRLHQDEQRIAEKNNCSIINLDAKTINTEQDFDEKIGVEETGFDLFEQSQVSIVLATLLLESYQSIKNANPTSKMFNYNKRVEKNKPKDTFNSIEVLKDNELYEIVKRSTESNVDDEIFQVIGSKIDEMKEYASRRSYVKVLAEYEDFVNVVNSLNKCFSPRLLREFEANTRAKMRQRIHH